MQTKLTLRIDDRLIKKAKLYSAETGRSVSQVVADFFARLEVSAEEEDLPPLVLALKGALRGADATKDHYHRYLEERYL